MILYVFNISIRVVPRHPEDGQWQHFGRQLITQECKRSGNTGFNKSPAAAYRKEWSNLWCWLGMSCHMKFFFKTQFLQLKVRQERKQARCKNEWGASYRFMTAESNVRTLSEAGMDILLHIQLLPLIFLPLLLAEQISASVNESRAPSPKTAVNLSFWWVG